MNKGIRIALVTALFCALGLVCYAIAKMNEERRHQVTCAGVKVEFADDFNFVTAEDIEGYLKKEYGAYIGQRLDSLDLVKVEKILDGKGAILKTEAYTTPDGLLNVKVFQREPLVRFQKGNTGFYADEKGFIFPLQNNYTSRVPIVDGAVPLNVASGYKGEAKTPQEKQWLSRIIAMVTFMEASKVWAENISQITVKPRASQPCQLIRGVHLRTADGCGRQVRKDWQVLHCHRPGQGRGLLFNREREVQGPDSLQEIG